MSASVLMVVTGLAMGGAEAELVQVAERLSERGWRLRVVSLVSLTLAGSGGLAERLEGAGIEVHSLEMKRGLPDLRALWRLRGWIRSWRPDIVHSFMVHANVISRLARLVAPIPVQISTAQNISEGGRFRELLYRITDSLADRTTQVSEAGAHRYEQRRLVAPDRIEVIRNSVDPNRFAPDPEVRAEVRAELGLGETFTWLAVGHLTPQKAYPTLLQAMALTLSKDRVLIAGRGSEREKIESLIIELGLGDRVSLLGFRADVGRLLSAADGFVMPSAWEGTPLALLEAAASALPSVATDVGGNAEVLADGIGFIVPAAAPQELAAAMERVVSMPQAERQELGAKARARVTEEYGLERNVERWETLYRRLLAKRGLGSRGDS